MRECLITTSGQESSVSAGGPIKLALIISYCKTVTQIGTKSFICLGNTKIWVSAPYKDE